MRHRDAFSGFHPLINFLFFALVLLFSMCLFHPVSLLISLGCAMGYCAHLTRRRRILWLLPTAGMAAILNPVFNHAGVTILTYLPSGNPLTLESLLYGLAAGGMLAAVLAWFACYTAVMSSDKFLYLFGRIIPALSLLLSMALGFVPKFKAQLHTVAEGQRALGRDLSQGSLLRRGRLAVGMLSILLTWSLENAVETADSMKCRGYGLPGRSAYSPYRFDRRDGAVLLWLLLLGGVLLGGWLSGGLHWRYFPSVAGAGVSPLSVSMHLVYLALCLTPLFLDWQEERSVARTLERQKTLRIF